ncbi:uncharacterized protein LOC143165540 [Aptenodytes patagonicus]|uniref:uncharacterized protein LOC143165540 n=1 Tax=Aptenodytes patagonicus TaxID=9234 RepID=UPI003F9EECA2
MGRSTPTSCDGKAPAGSSGSWISPVPGRGEICPPGRFPVHDSAFLSSRSVRASRCALGSKWEGNVDMKWAKAVLQLSCDDTALPGTTRKKNIQKRWRLDKLLEEKFMEDYKINNPHIWLGKP